MKNNDMYTKILFTGLFFLSFTVFQSLGQQAKTDSTAQKPKSTIPTDVNAILTNSCAKCHGETGRARFALDLSKWEGYSAEMKAKKAKEIMTTIDNGSMPPKGFLNANPGAAVSKQQAELIRNWSVTFPAKKGK